MSSAAILAQVLITPILDGSVSLLSYVTFPLLYDVPLYSRPPWSKVWTHNLPRSVKQGQKYEQV